MLESSEEAFEGFGFLCSFKANSYRIFEPKKCNMSERKYVLGRNYVTYMYESAISEPTLHTEISCRASELMLLQADIADIATRRWGFNQVGPKI